MSNRLARARLYRGHAKDLRVIAADYIGVDTALALTAAAHNYEAMADGLEKMDAAMAWSAQIGQ